MEVSGHGHDGSVTAPGQRNRSNWTFGGAMTTAYSHDPSESTCGWDDPSLPHPSSFQPPPPPSQRQVRPAPAPPHPPSVLRPTIPKATRHRKRHVPVGPAGRWFEQQKQLQKSNKKKKQRHAGVLLEDATLECNNNHNIEDDDNDDNNNNNDFDNEEEEDDDDDDNEPFKTSRRKTKKNAAAESSSCSTHDDKSFYSPAWLAMQCEMQWHTPHISGRTTHDNDDDDCDNDDDDDNVQYRYKRLRPHVPSTFLLIPDVTPRLERERRWKFSTPHENLMVLVEHVSTHHWLLWTVLLKDETGATVRAWIDPELVQEEQQHYLSSSSSSSSSSNNNIHGTNYGNDNNAHERTTGKHKHQKVLQEGYVWHLTNCSVMLRGEDYEGGSGHDLDDAAAAATTTSEPLGQDRTTQGTNTSCRSSNRYPERMLLVGKHNIRAVWTPEQAKEIDDAQFTAWLEKRNSIPHHHHTHHQNHSSLTFRTGGPEELVVVAENSIFSTERKEIGNHENRTCSQQPSQQPMAVVGEEEEPPPPPQIETYPEGGRGDRHVVVSRSVRTAAQRVAGSAEREPRIAFAGDTDHNQSSKPSKVPFSSFSAHSEVGSNESNTTTNNNNNNMGSTRSNRPPPNALCDMDRSKNIMLSSESLTQQFSSQTHNAPSATTQSPIQTNETARSDRLSNSTASKRNPRNDENTASIKTIDDVSHQDEEAPYAAGDRARCVSLTSSDTNSPSNEHPVTSSKGSLPQEATRTELIEEDDDDDSCRGTRENTKRSQLLWNCPLDDIELQFTDTEELSVEDRGAPEPPAIESESNLPKTPDAAAELVKPSHCESHETDDSIASNSKVGQSRGFAAADLQELNESDLAWSDDDDLGGGT